MAPWKQIVVGRRGARRSRSRGAHSAYIAGVTLDAFELGTLTTSVKPKPNAGSRTSSSGPSSSRPSARRTGALSRERENAGQKRFSLRAK
jgi:hypothetical protein